MPNFAGTWTVTTQGQARGQSTWPATPGAPTIGTATTTGITTATVAFTAPTNTGYPAGGITSYTATSSPGGITATGASSPISMTGLSGGTSYTFTVTATNATGTGPASSASNSITTNSLPSYLNQFAVTPSAYAPSYISADSSGNMYLAAAGQPVAGADAVVAKYNSTGAIQWQRKLASAGSANDYGRGVATDSSGNVYMAVSSATIGTGVVKYDSSGTLQWQRNFRDTTAGYTASGASVAVDSSGNVYLLGTTNNGTVTGIAIAKYNSSGTIQWQRSLTSSTSGSGCYGWGIGVDSSGNVYAAQSTNTQLTIVVAKWDTSGTFQWQRSLTSAGFLVGFYGSFFVDASGNCYTCTNNNNNSGGGIYIAKWDSSGTLQWQTGLFQPSTGQVNGYAITADSSGNVYAAGMNPSVSPAGLVIGKWNSSGTLQWQRSITVMYNGNTNPVSGIAVDNNGSYYLATTKGSTDYFYTWKLPDDGGERLKSCDCASQC